MDQLLLSYISPHQETTSSTVSKWIKKTLKLTGVNDFDNFGVHSTRSASTSKANLTGHQCLIFYQEVHGLMNLFGNGSITKILFLVKKYIKRKFFFKKKL